MLNTEKNCTTSNELTDVHVLITVSPEGKGSKYRVYLDQPITRANQYRNLVEFLATAGQDDLFELILNGPGGHLTTCVQLIHAIANTEAKVVGHLVGDIASAHSNIFMACHEHVVYPYSCMMVHTFSGGNYGKGEDLVRCAEAWAAQTKALYTDLFAEFLSEEELYMVLHGNNDRYFIGQDIVDRLQKVYAKRNEILQGMIAEERLAREDEVLERALEIMQSRGALDPEPQQDVQINITGDTLTDAAVTELVDSFVDAVEENLSEDENVVGPEEPEPFYEGVDEEMLEEAIEEMVEEVVKDEEDDEGLGSSIAGSLGIPVDKDD